MPDERMTLNQELVEHCAAAAKKDFGLYAMVSGKDEVLWQAIAATVIIEAVKFMKAGNPLKEFLEPR